MAQSIKTTKSEDWVNEDIAASELNLKKRTLQNYVSSGRIPIRAIKRNIINKRLYHLPTLKSPINN